MTNQLRKITAAVALACLPAMSAQAAIQFNNLQGTNPLESGLVEGFGTNAGNYVFDAIDQTKNAGACTPGALDLTPGSACVGTLAPGFLYGQAVISGFKLEGGGNLTARPSPPALANEYTIVIKVPVYTAVVAGGGTNVSLNAVFNPNAGGSFFEIWAGDRDVNHHAGTGFNNGDLILFGTAANISGLQLTSDTANPFKRLDDRTASGVTSDPPREYTVASGEPVVSIENSGSVSIQFDVTGGDIAYFPTLPTSIFAGFDINPFGPTLKAPFTNVAPTGSFAAIGGPAITYSDSFGDDTVLNPAGLPLGTYYINDFNCGSTQPCVYMVEGAGDGTFDVTTVPEPGVLALLGLGLAGLGAFTRRRRSA